LEQVQVGVHHRIAKIALDVRHGLTFDLQSVSYPQLVQDFVERHLKFEDNANATKAKKSFFFYLLEVMASHEYVSWMINLLFVNQPIKV
jgi:hypothetical protein